MSGTPASTEVQESGNHWVDPHACQIFSLITFLGVVILLAGMIFFSYNEEVPVLDALYFTTTTLTTIGYGDIVPKTGIGKMAAMYYAALGMTIMGYSLSLTGEMSSSAIRRAMDRVQDGMGSADPYVVLKADGAFVARSQTIKNNLEPTWQPSVWQVPQVPDRTTGHDIVFEVWDHDRFTHDDHIGNVALQTDELNLTGAWNLVENEIKLHTGQATIAGHSTLVVSLRKSPYDGHVEVKLVRCTNLPVMDRVHFQQFLDKAMNLKAEVLLVTLLVTVLVTGGGGIFALLEGWSFGDGVYFAFFSFMTVGYGDFVPETNSGKVFVIPFAILSIALLGFIIAVVQRVAISSATRDAFRGGKLAPLKMRETLLAIEDCEVEVGDVLLEMTEPEMGLEPVERFYKDQKMKTYTGTAITTWMMNSFPLTRSQAEKCGEQLFELELIEHIAGRRPFRDGYFFYHLTKEAVEAVEILREGGGIGEEQPRAMCVIPTLSPRVEAGVAVLFITFMLSAGAMFLSFIESWWWFEGFYFCFCTLTTIGYGDIVVKTSGGKAFAVIYTILGVTLLIIGLSFLSRASVELAVQEAVKQMNNRSRSSRLTPGLARFRTGKREDEKENNTTDADKDAEVEEKSPTSQFWESIYGPAVMMLVVVAVVIFIGSAVLMTLEPKKLSPYPSALYFSVISVTTVGFGQQSELHATSTGGRLFLMVFISVAMTLFFYTLHAVRRTSTDLLRDGFDRILSNQRRRRSALKRNRAFPTLRRDGMYFLKVFTAEKTLTLKGGSNFHAVSLANLLKGSSPHMKYRAPPQRPSILDVSSFIQFTESDRGKMMELEAQPGGVDEAALWREQPFRYYLAGDSLFTIAVGHEMPFIGDRIDASSGMSEHYSSADSCGHDAVQGEPDQLVGVVMGDTLRVVHPDRTYAFCHSAPVTVGAVFKREVEVSGGQRQSILSFTARDSVAVLTVAPGTPPTISSYSYSFLDRNGAEDLGDEGDANSEADEEDDGALAVIRIEASEYSGSHFVCFGDDLLLQVKLSKEGFGEKVFVLYERANSIPNFVP